ncbi:hypothetical protein U716_13540 [Rhodobacter capsulatus B6]|nr:hypothetical protein U716_13540 [Rhodobacter capsulatus B6]
MYIKGIITLYFIVIKRESSAPRRAKPGADPKIDPQGIDDMG